MNYLDIYTKTLIPNLNLEGLIEQKRLFEGMELHEDKQIYAAICDRINRLMEEYMLNMLKN